MPFISNIFFCTFPIGMEYGIIYLLLALLWAGEHFLIQASLFDTPPITRHPLFYQVTRLGVNILAAVFILSIASLPWTLTLIGLDFILSLVVIAYQKYFEKPFKPFLAIRNLFEGIKISSFAIRIIPQKIWLGMITLLFTKAFLAFEFFDNGSSWKSDNRYWIAALSALLYVALILFLQFTSFRFTSLRNSSISRILFAYGYSTSWIADFLLSPKIQQVSHELESLRKSSPDRLQDNFIPYQVDSHVVILQVESLDWNILNHLIDGKPITPFLNELAATSREAKIVSYHDQGSADMDYAVLACGLPSKRMVTYLIPGLTFPDSLPKFMSEHGYLTTAMHGNTGDFFNRRNCFNKMGWDEIYFREELQKKSSDCSYWGIRDKEVLKFSSQKLKNATQPEFHFIITLDSHGPFNLIKEEEKTIFPKSRNWQENYFNSMAALDKNLRDYVNALPTETLVVLYGDHTSGVNYQDFSPARDGDTEYVPCIVHKRTTGNSEKPNLIDPTSLPTDLSILDIIQCLRIKVESPPGTATL